MDEVSTYFEQKDKLLLKCQVLRSEASNDCINIWYILCVPVQIGFQQFILWELSDVIPGTQPAVIQEKHILTNKNCNQLQENGLSITYIIFYKLLEAFFSSFIFWK